MTMDDLILTVRARRLMKEIRRMRGAVHLSVKQAAKALGIGESTLWRMENGKSRISVEVLLEMLDLYDVRSPEREALERLGVDAVRRGWWNLYSDVFAGSYIALESDASQIRVNAFVVPGFFQTEAYALAAIASSRPELDYSEVERRMAGRLARQKALFEDRDDPPTVHVLLDETVVRRQGGGPVAMRQQLEHLAEVAQWPNATIQIIPFAVGFHAGVDGEFVIIDYPDPEDEPFVYEEGLFGDLYLEEDAAISRYRLAFDHAVDAALTPEKSLTLIRKIAKEMK
jgi:transcriptional regulator with XRE-family HTH domain